MSELREVQLIRARAQVGVDTVHRTGGHTQQCIANEKPVKHIKECKEQCMMHQERYDNNNIYISHYINALLSTRSSFQLETAVIELMSVANLQKIMNIPLWYFEVS